MPTGAAHRFSDTTPPVGGNLTADNLNSLDAGLNVYVSPNGGLNVRVTPGVLWRVFAGAATRSDNAGQSSDLAVDPSATSCIYIDAAGTVTKAAAFPATPHVPLAEVVASGSAITSITDKRPRTLLLAEGGVIPPQGYLVGGYYADRPEGASDAGALSADTLYLVPIHVERRVAVDRLACEVTTLFAAQNARIGLYPEGATPGSPAGATLLADSGTFSVATTGVKEATVALVLQPGRYFGAIVCGHATPAFRAYGLAQARALGLDPTSFAQGRCRYNGGAHAVGTNLPATCPAVTPEVGVAPVIAFRAA